jgi:hypothetical protein
MTSNQTGVWRLLLEKQTDKYRLADWYLGALYALANHNNPDRFAHAAQSLRELFEKLPLVLTGNATGSRRERVGRNLIATDPLWTFLPQETREGNVDSLFAIYKELEPFAHHSSLAGKRRFTEILADIDNAILRLFAPTTAENQFEIQKIISKGENIATADIERVLTIIKNRGANFAFFFKHVTNSVWLKPLREAAIFKKPPRVIPVGENQVSFPYWWPLEFLKRMTTIAPEEVVGIVLDMEKTDNPTVLNGIVEVALKLPDVRLSIRLEGVIRNLLEQPYRTFHNDMPELLACWAGAGGVAISPAIRLCGEVLGYCQSWQPDVISAS